MSDVFEEAMRGQFDACQLRFADDEFADDFGKAIVGRVKRRRMVTTTAIGGGTVVAVGAIAVAALNLPLGSATPASSPGCVTWSPSPAPYPVATISPDPTDFSYDVTLPDGDGVMTLARSNGVQEGFDVTLPDGTTFKAPADDASGASVFKLPNLPLVVVAKEDFSGNLTVSVGGADAVVVPTYGGLPPRVVSDATPPPIVDCGTTTGATAIASPFVCGFHVDPRYREDDALTITGAGYKTVPAAAAMVGDPNLKVANPVVSNVDPLVPYVTAVNNEVPDAAAGTGLDPADQRVKASVGVTTGVAVVAVQDGVVVAVPNEGVPASGVVRGQIVVRGNGVSALVLDTDYFSTCPGVTSTAYATLYAVAGSQTLVRQDAKEPPIYVWQQLRGVGQ